MKSAISKRAPATSKRAAQKGEGIPSDVLDRLLAVLETKGVRQTDFASNMGRSNDWASRTMKGERGLLIETLVKIADVYDVNLHWLITGQGEMFLTVTGEESTLQLLDEVIVKLKLTRKVLAQNR